MWRAAAARADLNVSEWVRGLCNFHLHEEGALTREQLLELGLSGDAIALASLKSPIRR